MDCKYHRHSFYAAQMSDKDPDLNHIRWNPIAGIYMCAFCLDQWSRDEAAQHRSHRITR
jgi:hypothetical protein